MDSGFEHPEVVARRGLYNHIRSLPFKDMELFQTDTRLKNAGLLSHQAPPVSIHLNDLARRLAELEKTPGSKKASPKPKTQTKTCPYTGRIVDACDN